MAEYLDGTSAVEDTVVDGIADYMEAKELNEAVDAPAAPDYMDAEVAELGQTNDEELAFEYGGDDAVEYMAEAKSSYQDEEATLAAPEYEEATAEPVAREIPEFLKVEMQQQKIREMQKTKRRFMQYQQSPLLDLVKEDVDGDSLSLSTSSIVASDAGSWNERFQVVLLWLFSRKQI